MNGKPWFALIDHANTEADRIGEAVLATDDIAEEIPFISPLRPGVAVLIARAVPTKNFMTKQLRRAGGRDVGGE